MPYTDLLYGVMVPLQEWYETYTGIPYALPKMGKYQPSMYNMIKGKITKIIRT